MNGSEEPDDMVEFRSPLTIALQEALERRLTAPGPSNAREARRVAAAAAVDRLAATDDDVGRAYHLYDDDRKKP